MLHKILRSSVVSKERVPTNQGACTNQGASNNQGASKTVDCSTAQFATKNDHSTACTNNLAVRAASACEHSTARFATDNLAMRPPSACDYKSVCFATENLAMHPASACEYQSVLATNNLAILSEFACDCPTVCFAAENDYPPVLFACTDDLALSQPTAPNAIVPTTTVLRKQSVLSLFLLAFTFFNMISHSFRFRTVVLLHAESNTTLLAQTTFMVSLYDGGSCAVAKPMGTLPGDTVPLTQTSHTFPATAGQQNVESITFSEAPLTAANDVCFGISDVVTFLHFTSPSKAPGAHKVHHTTVQGAHNKTITFESVWIKERVGLRPENILQSNTDPKATGNEKHTHVDVAIEVF